MPRRIASAEFVTSGVRPRDFPADGKPEIAMVGRSNVGKSSLINALLRKDVARTSASPGKTRQANVYRVVPAGGSPFYLVDLPGYGHAGGKERAREEFAAITASYFETRTPPSGGAPPGPLAGVVLAIDARHPGMASDVEAVRWASTLRVPFLIAATKVDKLRQPEKARLKRECETAFGMAPVAVSSVNGMGLDEVWRVLTTWVGN
jgi:GTP-binding protein